MKAFGKRLVAAVLLATSSAALAAGDILLHRDPGCGCCHKWAEQVSRQLGRPVRTVDDAQRPALQARLGIPAAFSSCHTAIIDGMAFEGHVPIADVKRLLHERPKGVAGLVVPGMPIGSPGMEAPGGQVEPYQVIAFGPGGPKVYARHP